MNQSTALDLRLETLIPGHSLSLGAEDLEQVVLVQRGYVSIDVGDGHGPTLMGGRQDVFSGPAAAAHLPAGQSAVLVALDSDAQIAVVAAAGRASGENPRVVQPSDVAVHVRGDGTWRREVHDVVLPLAGASSRLIVGETFSRGGIWSSFPPHRHAVADPPHETAHAEVFHVRVSPQSGFAVFLDYPTDTGPELARVLHDGDIVHVHGTYHSFACAAGHELYYLWALWGSERESVFRTDARHAWLNEGERSPT